MVPGGVPRILNLERDRHGKSQNQLPSPSPVAPQRRAVCWSQSAGWETQCLLTEGENNHGKMR